MLTRTLTTPIGPLVVGASAIGLAAVRFPRRNGRPAQIPATRDADDRAARHLDEACTALDAYFAGTLTRFELPIDWTGVEGLRRTVLGLIEDVPFGQVTTYGELARLADEPGAAQAVGQAMGSNPVPVVVPCHRVLAADGLGGFGGGLRTKEWLLAHEGALTMQLDFG